jgi:transketolase
MRKGFVSAATNVIENNHNSALILGDIGVFGFQSLKQKHPNRVLNLGILEQTMIGTAAGFSSENIIPIVHSIAPFLIERAYEQIKVDFGYQKLPGNLVSVGASFDYSKLGATHHCPADVNLVSSIPETKIFIPGHKHEFEQQFNSQWNSGTLNYFRLSEVENELKIDVNFGEIIKIKDGTLGTVLAVGPFLKETLTAVSDLDLEIHYLNSISPAGSMMIQSNFPGKKVIIHEPYYSGIVLQKTFEQISRSGSEILQIGVPKDFIHEYGTYRELLSFLDLDPESIRKRITRFIYE